VKREGATLDVPHDNDATHFIDERVE
jgi:hypothetical protein